MKVDMRMLKATAKSRPRSKAARRIWKSQVRAIAKVQRKQKLGQLISQTDLMRTGMPKSARVPA